MMASGQLRPLAVASRQRIDELPGVPSACEFYPSYALTSWQGLFGPAGKPQPSSSGCARRPTLLVAEKTFDGKLRTTLSGRAYPTAPEAFAAETKAEYEQWRADQISRHQDRIGTVLERLASPTHGGGGQNRRTGP